MWLYLRTRLISLANVYGRPEHIPGCYLHNAFSTQSLEIVGSHPHRTFRRCIVPEDAERHHTAAPLQAPPRTAQLARAQLALPCLHRSRRCHQVRRHHWNQTPAIIRQANTLPQQQRTCQQKTCFPFGQLVVRRFPLGGAVPAVHALPHPIRTRRYPLSTRICMYRPGRNSNTSEWALCLTTSVASARRHGVPHTPDPLAFLA